jgi:hypothetical protein
MLCYLFPFPLLQMVTLKYNIEQLKLIHAITRIWTLPVTDRGTSTEPSGSHPKMKHTKCINLEFQLLFWEEMINSWTHFHWSNQLCPKVESIKHPNKNWFESNLISAWAWGVTYNHVEYCPRQFSFSVIIPNLSRKLKFGYTDHDRMNILVPYNKNLLLFNQNMYFSWTKH